MTFLGEDEALAVCSAAAGALTAAGYVHYGLVVLSVGAFLKAVWPSAGSTSQTASRTPASPPSNSAEYHGVA